MAHLQKQNQTREEMISSNAMALTVKNSEDHSENLTVISNIQLAHTERKESRIRDLAFLFSEIDLAWGLSEVVNTQQADFLIEKLANDEYIISDAQFANAKAWILNGDRTYMGRNSTKLLLSDFTPSPAQLRSLESDCVRVLTKEELALMLNDKFKEGQMSSKLTKLQESDSSRDDSFAYLERENIRLSMELSEKKEEIKKLTKERDELISRLRNPSGALMQQLQGSGYL